MIKLTNTETKVIEAVLFNGAVSCECVNQGQGINLDDVRAALITLHAHGFISLEINSSACTDDGIHYVEALMSVEEIRAAVFGETETETETCLLYTSPSPRD